ncbi:MAG TPA: phosphatidylserine decarboxylase [Marmoricola sp.]|nr:phosphatidylserine decarboxylase [Marmoricola sp.]
MSFLDREAGPASLVASVPAAVAALTGHRRTAAALLTLPVAVAAFFRDPDRAPDSAAGAARFSGDPDLVVAPADGKVMHAGPAQTGVAPPGAWQQVSIFLSVFDVHINRTPYGGTVTDVTYRPGRWLAAYKFESATENERSEITIEREVAGRTRRIIFRQIVGLVARRVVTRVTPGQVLATGERIGLMKFGSRMDIFIPAGADLLVAKGDRTVAGETVIARWRQS